LYGDSNIAIQGEEKIRNISYPSLRDICHIWSNRLDKLRKQSFVKIVTEPAMIATTIVGSTPVRFPSSPPPPLLLLKPGLTPLSDI